MKIPENMTPVEKEKFIDKEMKKMEKFEKKLKKRIPERIKKQIGMRLDDIQITLVRGIGSESSMHIQAFKELGAKYNEFRSLAKLDGYDAKDILVVDYDPQYCKNFIPILKKYSSCISKFPLKIMTYNMIMGGYDDNFPEELFKPKETSGIFDKYHSMIQSHENPFIVCLEDIIEYCKNTKNKKLKIK